jgi:serine/threonine protein phosphatase PrpC
MALVADGVGGYAGGEIASGLVKQTLLESADTKDLESAILRAHARILSAAAENPQVAGMGSTVVAVQVTDRRCKVAWVGDSRGYLWRKASLQPLTRDHSVAEVLRDADHLSETQLRVHPLRHQVMQTLGRDLPAPSSGETALRRDDWILLCSDGLSGELRDHEIAEVLHANASLETAADALVSAAIVKGGHDNISVVLVQYDGPSSIEFPWMHGERIVVWLSILGGVVLAITVAAIGWWIKHRK